jgi:hypothetical protein
MANLSYIPSFYFYRFADAVSGPYTALTAYSSGLIDSRGNVKGNESSIDPFEYFVIKIKKIFDQLPPGTTKYKLQNLMGTLQVFNEEAEQFGITKEQFNCLVESHVMLNAEDGVSYLNLLEDMSTGSAGGGPGTLGTPADAPEANKGNVSGYDPVMGSMLTRSSPVNMFPSIEMFNVSKDEFNAFKAAKAWKQLQDSKTKKYLQRFQRRNKAGKMAVRDEESGEIFFIPYKEKSFIEENNLMGLSILNEESEEILLEDKRKVTTIFGNLIANATKTPLPGEKKPTAGDSEEHIARLIHGIRSLHTAVRADPRVGLDTFISSFDELSGKRTFENGVDAVELVQDPSGDLSKINLDAKGINTTIRQRADIPFQREMGIEGEVQDVKRELKTASGQFTEKDIKELSAEEIKKRLEAEPKVQKAASGLKQKIRSAFKVSDTLDPAAREYIINKYNLGGTEDQSGAVTPQGWSFLQPKGKARMVLSPEPSEGQTKVPAIVSGGALSRVLIDPKVFERVTGRPTITVKKPKKDKQSETGIRTEPEIWLRMPEIAQRRQRSLETVAKEMGTGNIVHANLDNDMMQTLKDHIDDDSVFDQIAKQVGGFIR